MNRFFLLALCLLALSPRLAECAKTGDVGRTTTNNALPGAPTLSPQDLRDFRTRGVPDERLADVVEAIGREPNQAAARALITAQQPFPRIRLVAMLASPRLGVRLGALDLLEEQAGDTFGFDPWETDPKGGLNAEALARWNVWAGSTNTAPVTTPSTLSAETFQRLAVEIMSGDRDRAERATARLAAFGSVAIPRIQSFLESQPDLETSASAALKSAQYRIALTEVMGDRARQIARDLAFGTPESQSTALATLADAGLIAFPVTGDFFDAEDPLVREAAIEAAFEAAGEFAVPSVTERIRKETSESVLHAMLRGLGKHPTAPGAEKALLGSLDSPSENVVVSTLEALKAGGGPEMRFNPGAPSGVTSSTQSLESAVRSKLSDPRWRVRATVLEVLSERSAKGLIPEITPLLKDPDPFVRTAAVNALANLSEVFPKALLEAFEQEDELKPDVIAAHLNKRQPVPDKLWAALSKAPPEIILRTLDLMDTRGSDEERNLEASRFVDHPNQDVSAAALRVLAGKGLKPEALLAALESQDAVKVDAVLDALRLPPNTVANSPSPSGTTRSANPKLAKLYDALAPTTSTPARQDAKARWQKVLTHFMSEGSPRQRFRAASVMASQGDAEATQALLGMIETMSSLDRKMVASSVAGTLKSGTPAAKELLQRLLRDEAPDVREEAIKSIWDSELTEVGVPILLEEVARPEAKLNAGDIYGYELEKVVESSISDTLRAWGKTTLSQETAPTHAKVLAIVLLGRVGGVTENEFAGAWNSNDPLLRRAVLRALGLPFAEKHLEEILNSPDARVRAALPYLAAPDANGWTHWFDDANSAVDNDRSGRSSGGKKFASWANTASGEAGKTANPVHEALERLKQDPSELVRFETLFALLRLGKSVDPGEFVALALTKKEASTRYRISAFLRDNLASINPAHTALMAAAGNLDREERAKLLSHFGISSETVRPKFPGLNEAPSTKSSPAPAIVEATPAPEAQEPFRVLFFSKPGCRECTIAREILGKLSGEFPKMRLEEFSIDETTAAELNEVLSARLGLREKLYQVTPSVFTQAGAIAGSDLTAGTLSDLIERTHRLPVNSAWAEIRSEEKIEAKERIVRRFEGFSLGVVAAAGLLDGINPCAFATIIFLLSYLHVARRSPRELLLVGSAFVAGVFSAYFSIGLGLSELLTRMTALQAVGTLFNQALAGMAFVFAILSFKDARLAAIGRMSEMTLQLPEFLKTRIRGTIRTGTRMRHFVWAAFGAGVVISVLELACTGQVYLPTILYMVRTGETGAVGYLAIYNVAFVLPLIAIFLLAWSGMRSEALVRFQEQHTPLVKTLTGIVFLLLAALLLFGHALLG